MQIRAAIVVDINAACNPTQLTLWLPPCPEYPPGVQIAGAEVGLVPVPGSESTSVFVTPRIGQAGAYDLNTNAFIANEVHEVAARAGSVEVGRFRCAARQG